MAKKRGDIIGHSAANRIGYPAQNSYCIQAAISRILPNVGLRPQPSPRPSPKGRGRK